MNSPLSHFIITRFNLRRSSDSLTTQMNLDAGWLRRRFELFDQFCYPSVRGQSASEFRWLVLLDEETPVEFKRQIGIYAQWPALIPVYLGESSIETTKWLVRECVASGTRVVVTTRLDNDDAICRTFVAQIRAVAEVTQPTLLEFPRGYVWKDGKVYRDWQPRNPFSSLAEPVVAEDLEALQTVYTGSHHDLGKNAVVRRVSNSPSWIQVIHGENVVNRVRGIRVLASAVARDFTIKANPNCPGEGRLGRWFDVALSLIRTGAQRALSGLRQR